MSNNELLIKWTQFIKAKKEQENVGRGHKSNNSYNNELKAVGINLSQILNSVNVNYTHNQYTESPINKIDSYPKTGLKNLEDSNYDWSIYMQKSNANINSQISEFVIVDWNSSIPLKKTNIKLQTLSIITPQYLYLETWINSNWIQKIKNPNLQFLGSQTTDRINLLNVINLIKSNQLKSQAYDKIELLKLFSFQSYTKWGDDNKHLLRKPYNMHLSFGERLIISYVIESFMLSIFCLISKPKYSITPDKVKVSFHLYSPFDPRIQFKPWWQAKNKWLNYIKSWKYFTLGVTGKKVFVPRKIRKNKFKTNQNVKYRLPMTYYDKLIRFINFMFKSIPHQLTDRQKK